MAEVKNSFLKSKMNQDLDDRLIPNGEYRYANNVSIGKAESEDVGALETVLGNDKLPLTVYNPESNPGLVSIGTFMDSQNNRIFQFLTDYEDPLPASITLPTSGTMRITLYDLTNLTYVTLVDGLFLNFAKNKDFRITGVNLIEGLLFWTDNRNQPRKINVTRAIGNSSYYTTEEQISVAKYAPVESITLYRKFIAYADGGWSANTITVEDSTGITAGMTLLTEDMDGSFYSIVTNVTGNVITLYEDLDSPVVDGQELTFLISTMSNKSDIDSWPGDPDFLEDRYVRFSYRFKFDDNEYSLIAPFTQIAYVPKQKGYFIAGNEVDAYRSTVLNWVENNINNIELIVPLPDTVGNLTNSYKITEIDIIYKESDALALKVFETIPVSSINSSFFGDNFYVQPYQSQKPYKTLPEDEIIRVTDKVPVRAKSQETVGNRIVYGNYFDKYTPVRSIDYNVSVQPKIPTGTNFIEYPNHTLKKNRNYQVGFILADKFGRQSPVILSSVDLQGVPIGGAQYAKGSTVYSSYEDSVLFTDVRTWFGNSLIVYVNGPINQQRDISSGQSGLYAAFTNINGFAITALTETSPTQYTFTLDLTALSSQYVPEVGNILRGKYVDYVTVLTSVKTYQTPGDPLTPIVSVVITTTGAIGDIYKFTPQVEGVKDIKFAYNYNSIGWYSYKIVVRQQEQDYYNVYLPGMLNGYPNSQTSGSQVVYSGVGATATSTLENGINTTQFPVSESGNTAHIVLINDNINKVPRDLSEVGPDQKQYRSSVRLYGRVENTEASLTIIGDDPLYSAKVTTITYDTTTPVGNEDWILIKPGDGIQCTQANTPIPNPDPLLGGTIPNPYRWLGDTTVVSNEVTGTVGVITISSPNWIIDTGNPLTTYKTFVITRAENKQYFPTRKADTVIAIASADEFNFLSNSTENISGTAGLNLYQLQNKPLIGRMSTVNSIGVKASDMIPFLSVYETSSQESLLDVFWETSTSGLISDLNADVLTGYDGPSGFSSIGYEHFEWQDPAGIGTATGAADSRYITDEFAVLNQSGTIIMDTSATLSSVTDGAGNLLRITDFELETIPMSGVDPTFYRLKIRNPLVFNYSAPSLESYEFTLLVTNNPASLSNTLTITNRLGNKPPIITTDILDYNIDQTFTSITTLVANNGSYVNAGVDADNSNSISGLKWSIVSGNAGGYFSLNANLGTLSLVNPLVPLGIYELVIKVEDAIDIPTGLALVNANAIYATLDDTITLSINVGDQPVDFLLRPIYESTGIITPGTSCEAEPLPPIGISYIGTKIAPDLAYLPEIGGVSGPYQFIENVEIENWGVPVIPTGLTQGEYRFRATMSIPCPSLCAGGEGAINNVQGSIKLWVYRRQYGGVWALVPTENNVTIEQYPTPVVNNSQPSGIEKLLSTTFTIEADPATLYEYAIGTQWVGVLNNSSDPSPSIYVGGQDANYTYDTITPDYSIPIITSYPYYTGFNTIIGDASSVPWSDQDATRGLNYYSPTNLVTSGDIIAPGQTFDFTLSVANPQLTPGLAAAIYNSTPAIVASGNIAQINVGGNPLIVKIQLNSAWGGANQDIAGGNIQFTAGAGAGVGMLYSNTMEGTELKRLYTDAALTTKWIPPVANRFYILQMDSPEGTDYNPSNNAAYTNYPYFCAQINANGLVMSNPIGFDVQTAWTNAIGGPLNNYGYNIFYNEII